MRTEIYTLNGYHMQFALIRNVDAVEFLALGATAEMANQAVADILRGESKIGYIVGAVPGLVIIYVGEETDVSSLCYLCTGAALHIQGYENENDKDKAAYLAAAICETIADKIEL